MTHIFIKIWKYLITIILNPTFLFFQNENRMFRCLNCLACWLSFLIFPHVVKNTDWQANVDQNFHFNHTSPAYKYYNGLYLATSTILVILSHCAQWCWQYLRPATEAVDSSAQILTWRLLPSSFSDHSCRGKPQLFWAFFHLNGSLWFQAENGVLSLIPQEVHLVSIIQKDQSFLAASACFWPQRLAGLQVQLHLSLCVSVPFIVHRDDCLASENS